MEPADTKFTDTGIPIGLAIDTEKIVEKYSMPDVLAALTELFYDQGQDEVKNSKDEAQFLIELNKLAEVANFAERIFEKKPPPPPPQKVGMQLTLEERKLILSPQK